MYNFLIALNLVLIAAVLVAASFGWLWGSGFLVLPMLVAMLAGMRLEDRRHFHDQAHK